MKQVKIISVDEFTIGDTVCSGSIKSMVISKFWLVDNLLCAEDRNTNTIYIKNLAKVIVKKPIYTTTDRIDIYEGYNVTLYLLNKDLAQCIRNKVNIFKFNEQDKEVADRYLTFTSEENRDKYIKENSKKPVFISADNVEYFEEDEGKKEIWHNNNWNANWRYFKLESLHPDTEYYSTADACNGYIDNNKPKYSLVDIENAYCKSMKHEFNGLGDILEELKKLGK